MPPTTVPDVCRFVLKPSQCSRVITEYLVAYCSTAEEPEDYLLSPRLAPTADVLAFWKANKSTYHQLAELAWQRMAYRVSAPVPKDVFLLLA